MCRSTFFYVVSRQSLYCTVVSCVLILWWHRFKPRIWFRWFAVISSNLVCIHLIRYYSICCTSIYFNIFPIHVYFSTLPFFISCFASYCTLPSVHTSTCGGRVSLWLRSVCLPVFLSTPSEVHHFNKIEQNSTLYSIFSTYASVECSFIVKFSHLLMIVLPFIANFCVF